MTVALSQAHRVAQLRLGARLVVLLRSAFGILNPKALDESFADWLVVVEPLVQNTRVVSARMAAAYLTSSRVAAVGFDTRFVPQLAGPADEPALRASLLVTGPVSIKNAMRRGVLLSRAVDIAEARSSAAAMRHALDGGRHTILATVRADDRAVGWRRVASGKSCAFCSSLAGKAAPTDEGASFQAHDGCSCSAEPVYR